MNELCGSFMGLKHVDSRAVHSECRGLKLNLDKVFFVISALSTNVANISSDDRHGSFPLM